MLKKAIIIIYFLIIIILGFTTFVEQVQGNDFAKENYYTSWWMCSLWVILTLMSVVSLFLKKLYKRLYVFALHVSLVIILLGGLVTHIYSEEGYIHLRKGICEKAFVLKENNQAAQLPFTIKLDSFAVKYYPATNAPSDYVSYVEYSVDENNKKDVVSMNNILQVEGFRLYQSSFDPDMLGTWLTVNHDPYGTSITYFGYALLAISMICVLFNKRETFAALVRNLIKATDKAILLAAIVSISSFAVSLPAHARKIPAASVEEAEQMKRQQVVYNDRIVPFDTAAKDFLKKIYGKDSYKGLNAEQVISGWAYYPEVWKDEKMILVKKAEIRQRIGATEKYVSFSQLFDSNQQYKLNAIIEDILKEKGMNSSIMKDVMQLDEKAGLIKMLVEGSLFTAKPKDLAPLSDSKVEAELIYNAIPFSKVLFMANLTFGFISFFLLLYKIIKRKTNKLIKYSDITLNLILVLSFLFHLFGYLLRWYIGGRIPLSNGFETMQFMALSIMIITILLNRRIAFIRPFGFILSGFTLLVSYLGEMNPQITPLMPVLQSPILSSHVSVIMISYALLSFMLLNGITSVILIRHYKRTHDEYIKNNVDLLTILSKVMLYPAVFLLAVGIFLGAIWANVSWGNYWSWDPKEVWALITLMVYSVPFHSNSIRFFRKPANFHLYLCLAFIMVLMTYFGVNYILGGMHSYAN